MNQNDAVGVPLPLRSLRRLCRILGGFYCATGLAKIPVFFSFAGTIQTIFPVSAAFGQALACAVIVVEAGCGAAVFLTFRSRMFVLALMVLTAAFLWILFPAAVLHRPFTCNCFGVIGVSLPTFWEFILDLLLVDLLGILAILFPFRPGSGHHVRKGTLLAAVTFFAIIMAVEASLVRRAAGSGGQTPPSLQLDDLIAFADARQPGILNRSHRTMLFLLNFQDFTCSLCFEDFVDLADSLRADPTRRATEGVLAVMQEGGAERLLHDNRIERWIAETGLPFPLVIAPDSLFARSHFRKSALAVLDRHNSPLLVSELPIGPRGRSLALRLLRNM
jgi:hypothetical protein